MFNNLKQNQLPCRAWLLTSAGNVRLISIVEINSSYGTLRDEAGFYRREDELFQTWREGVDALQTKYEKARDRYVAAGYRVERMRKKLEAHKSVHPTAVPPPEPR